MGQDVIFLVALLAESLLPGTGDPRSFRHPQQGLPALQPPELQTILPVVHLWAYLGSSADSSRLARVFHGDQLTRPRQ